MTRHARAAASAYVDHSTTALVRGAVADTSSSGRRHVGGGVATSGTLERIMAPILGLYLGWVVARVPEVFPALFVPRLPMITLLLFIVCLAVGISGTLWQATWKRSTPLRLVVVLGALVVVTIPIGIWPSGSIWFMNNKYLISFVVFLASLMFLRDRTNLRRAVAVYVLCVGAISAKTLRAYDPDQLVQQENGEWIPRRDLPVDQQRIVISVSLDPNDFGALVAVTVPLALWLAAGSLMRRFVWGGTALVMVAATVPTASRGALIGLVAVALTLVAFGATGWRRSFFLLMITVGGFLFATIATQGQLTRFFEFGSDDYNVEGNEGRLWFWKQGMVWMIKRPWGYGIGNYSTYFGWLNGPERAAHSMWVQYGMELGVLGLVTAVALCRYLLRGLKAMRAAAVAAVARGNAAARADGTLAGHMMASLVGLLVTGSFLSNAYYPLTYMVWGFAGAVLLNYAMTTPEVNVAAPSPAPLQGRIQRRNVLQGRRV